MFRDLLQYAERKAAALMHVSKASEEASTIKVNIHMLCDAIPTVCDAVLILCGGLPVVGKEVAVECQKRVSLQCSCMCPQRARRHPPSR
jgi:hypothetical protein